MINADGSTHLMLSRGRSIQENSEFALSHNATHVVQYPNYPIFGVSAFIPPQFPHMLADIDGTCHSVLPVVLAEANIGSHPDGSICLKRNRAAKRSEAIFCPVSEIVTCSHVLLYLLDTHTACTVDEFRTLFSGGTFWSECMEVAAAVDIFEATVKDGEDEDENAVFSSLTSEMLPIILLFRYLLIEAEKQGKEKYIQFMLEEVCCATIALHLTLP